MTQSILGKYSFGVGDRFAQQAAAQIAAIELARKQGISITPVWNKSFREHAIARTEPIQTRRSGTGPTATLLMRITLTSTR
jgi:hypothetical protein